MLSDADAQSSSSDEGSDGWEEVGKQCEQCFKCLVCPEVVDDSEIFFQHLYSHDKWKDLLTSAQCPVTDQYDWIRFVNCVRQKGFQDWRQVLDDPCWKSRSIELLHSTLKDDAVLSIDIESVLEESGKQIAAEPVAESRDASGNMAAQRLEEENALLRNQVSILRKALSDFCDDQTSTDFRPEPMSNVTGCRGDSVRLDSSPSSFVSGLKFLDEPAILSAYRNFIRSNGVNYFRDKCVLDFECGPAILSLFATEANAARVLAVDNDPRMLSIARAAIRDNKLEDQISLFQGGPEIPELPVDQIDSIIFKPTGYFLSKYSVTPLMQLVRRIPTNRPIQIFPRCYSMKLMGLVCGTKLRHQLVDKWLNLCGYRFDSVHREALSKVHLLDLAEFQRSTQPPLLVNSSPSTLYTMDMLSLIHKQAEPDCPPDDPISNKYAFGFTVSHPGPVLMDALVCYVELQFQNEAPCQVIFTTSPKSGSNGWKQALFFLPNPIQVDQGDRVSGTLTVQHLPHDDRHLELFLHLDPPHDSPAVCQRYTFVRE